MASGLATGDIVIFDCDTYGVLTVLHEHFRPIQSLSWSHSSQYLLSASRDWKCIVWDLATGQPHRVFNFETPVWSAHFHPFSEKKFVVSLVEENARFVDFSNEEEKDDEKDKEVLSEVDKKEDTLSDLRTNKLRKKSPEPRIVVLDTSVHKEPEPEPEPEPDESDEATSTKKTKKSKSGKKKKKGPQQASNIKQSVLTAIFNATGDYIITGTSRGTINIIKTGSSEIVYSKDITSSKIKSIIISSSGRYLVANASDRIVRLMSLPDMRYPPPLKKFGNENGKENEEQHENGVKKEDGNEYPEWEIEIEHKFSDVVNRLQWNSIAISPTAEYIIASTYEDAHVIYMWETTVGSLVKIYEGPKEELVEVIWHPSRPLIAANGLESGKIHIWSSIPPQRWSALAPDFIEVEENVVYEEAENEFDRLYEEVDDDKMHEEEEEDDIDIFSEFQAPGMEQMEASAFAIPLSLDIEEDLQSDSD